MPTPARDEDDPAPYLVAGRLEVPLPDGSLATIEPIASPGCGASLISRYVDGELVWGQSFSSFVDEHPAQVARVLAAMADRPADFTRWWLRPGCPAATVERGAA